MWMYGTGFPKSHDVSKGIDRELDAEDEREVVDREEKPNPATGVDYGDYGDDGVVERTAPATEEAAEWDGWGTCLKPGFEPVVLARKPLGESTIAANVLTHGTGALNIDGCRISVGDERPDRDITTGGGADSGSIGDQIAETSGMADGTTTEGRFPANVLLDGDAAEQLDEQTGETAGQGRGGQSMSAGEGIDNDVYGNGYERSDVGYDDGGGPSRFFYTSKASSEDRTVGGRKLEHPTVKPVDLMQWLVRLVAAEGQVVLDPFAGTGTTLEAAQEEGRGFVGVEQDSRWARAARIRVGLERPDGDWHEGPQQSIDEFASAEEGETDD